MGADPTVKPKNPKDPWPLGLGSQILTTAILAAALAAGSFLPLPGFLVDQEVLQSLMEGQGLWGNSNMGLLSLGVSPFIIGFGLVELFALAVPRLRRKRLSDLGLRKRLWRASLMVGAIWAFIQGLSVAFSLEGMQGYYQVGYGSNFVVQDSGWAFRLSCAALLTAGSGVFALFAWLIDRYGTGRGFAVAIVVSFLVGLPGGASTVWRYLGVDAITPMSLILLLGLLIGLPLVFSFLWRHAQGRAGDLPIRLPVCGLFPLELALLFLSLPVLANSFFYLGWLESLSQALTPDSKLYIGLKLGMVAVFAAPIATMFYWRRKKDLSGPKYRGTWRRAQALSASFLACLIGLDYLIGRLNPSLLNIWPGALVMLVLWALVADWLEEVLAQRRAPQGVPLKIMETHQDLSDALASLKVFAQLQPEHKFVLTGARYRSLTYVFGPYIPLHILGPQSAQPRSSFSGGEVVEESELAAEFE